MLDNSAKNNLLIKTRRQVSAPVNASRRHDSLSEGLRRRDWA